MGDGSHGVKSVQALRLRSDYEDEDDDEDDWDDDGSIAQVNSCVFPLR